MRRISRVAAFVTLAHVAPSFADCGDMAKRLLGIEMGGQRSYLTQLPSGLSLTPVKQDWKSSGIDVLTGNSHKIQFAQISVYWHKDRIASVIARAQAPTASNLDEALQTVSSLASLQFTHDARSDAYQLPCKDHLSVRARKGEIGRAGGKAGIPVLMLSIDHPLKVEMEKDLRGNTKAQ